MSFAARVVLQAALLNPRLPRAVDFLTWKAGANLREAKVIRRYHIQKPEDYHRYNKLAGMITSELKSSAD